jgi:hypothetical protein
MWENIHVSTIATVVRKTTNTERFPLKLLCPISQVCTNSSTHFQKTNPRALREWRNSRNRLTVLIHGYVLMNDTLKYS